MAWERRHNLHRYYYRKRRLGGRVISKYVGSGPVAQLIADLDKFEQEERREKRHERLRMIEQDQEIDEALGLSIDMASVMLLLAGYHNNKGKWVRRRGRRVE